MRIAICAAIVPVCGCSLIMASSVSPQSRPEEIVGCVGSAAPVLYDVVSAVGDTILVITASSAASSATNSSDQQALRGYAVGAGVVGVIYAASAIYGASATSSCRDAKADFMRRYYSDAFGGRSPREPSPRDTQRPSDGACSSDLQCKGDRVCDSGACVSPRPTPR